MSQAPTFPHGLLPRGGFNFKPNEDTPPGPQGRPARAVLLVGTAGTGYWPHFQAWRQDQPGQLDHPLDAWSREIIEMVAGTVGARAVFPSDRPFLPFQQWAMRAEGLKPSPLGILMHPIHGPWHAYRGALLFEEALDLPPLAQGVHACDICEKQPCRKACPVAAHAGEVFAYQDCLSFAGGPGADICGSACLDRNACPVGTAYRYPVDVQHFHQRAFLLPVTENRPSDPEPRGETSI